MQGPTASTETGDGLERITATYRVETPLPLDVAAATLAGEQSSGTFVAVPGETDELKQRFAARVESITPQETVEAPSLPGCPPGSRGGPFQRGEVVVSWSLENVGYNLPTLASTLQGNLYELSSFSGLKLIDFDVPPSFAGQFTGPRFGISGTRRLAGVEGRPLIGTIIKPSVGLSPSQTADLVTMLVEAGTDFIKDDELMANPPHSPFHKRVEAVMRVIDRHADRTGRRVMVAFNVSDELDAMMRHYETLVAASGTCAMVSLNSVGLCGVKKLCDQGAVAVHGHRNGWGMLNRHPLLGIEFSAYQKMWRLAGVDQIHVNGIQNKFWESDESVVRSIEACLTPLFGKRGTMRKESFSTARSGGLGNVPVDTDSPPLPHDRFAAVMPVISSGQWGGQAFETFRRTRTIDVLYLAGGGILAHPDGPAAGVRAIRHAWQAAVEGLTLDEAAATCPELARSVEKFGR